MLSQEQISANHRRYVELLQSVNRPGMDKVIAYLEENGFFNIPSSLHRHHNWEGGLAQHCLGVYDRLRETGPDLPHDSVVITSLLHDVCKARKVYRDDAGQWRERHDAELHIPGHGSRSVKLLEKVLGLPLTPEERGAIRWHMGGYMVPPGEAPDFYATRRSNLWRLLHNADRYDARHNGKAL